MTNEYDFLKKQRYEYYKGTTEIMDNEVNELVEDVVDVLNKKDYNIIELLKIKQIQAQRIAELEKDCKYYQENYYIMQEEKEHFERQSHLAKQQLAEQPKQIMEKIKERLVLLGVLINGQYYYSGFNLDEIIEIVLKEYNNEN